MQQNVRPPERGIISLVESVMTHDGDVNCTLTFVSPSSMQAHSGVTGFVTV